MTQQPPHALRLVWPLLLMAALTVLVTVGFAAIGSEEINQALTEALIRMVLALGLYMFIGNSGIISFGHIAFVMIGANATTWQTCCEETRAMFMPGLPTFLLTHTTPPIAAALVGGGLAAAVALVAGAALMRLSGIAASIGTFALLMVVHSVYLRWNAWTAGPRVITGIPVVVDVWFALGFVLPAMAIAFFYGLSKSGMSLRAARDDQVAALACGVNVYGHRLLAFVLSAAVAGVAGGLMSQFLGMVTVSTFYLDMTFVALSMLVVGGMASLSGAVVGIIVMSIIIELLRRLETDVTIAGFGFPPNSAEVGLGVLMLLILLFRPTGLTRNREILWPFRAGELVSAQMRRQG
jgi:branched-chain amino acid transport system permease protein